MNLIALRTKELEGTQKPGHFARDCRAPKAAPTASTTQGARPTAKGRVYCMGT
ncbi:hypothetical protein A2U01_0070004, partial [Trifolium medium]|nr:hypothetical protein [Trifolium medium]